VFSSLQNWAVEPAAQASLPDTTVEERWALPFMLGSTLRTASISDTRLVKSHMVKSRFRSHAATTLPTTLPRLSRPVDPDSTWFQTQIVTHPESSASMPFATQVWAHEAGPVAVLMGTNRLQFYYINDRGFLVAQGPSHFLPIHVTSGAFAPWLKNSTQEVYYFAISGQRLATIGSSDVAAPSTEIRFLTFETQPDQGIFRWRLSTSVLRHPYLTYDNNQTFRATWGYSLGWTKRATEDAIEHELYVFSNQYDILYPGGALFIYGVIGQSEQAPRFFLKQVIGDPYLFYLHQQMSLVHGVTPPATASTVSVAARGFGHAWCMNATYPDLPTILFVSNSTSEEGQYGGSVRDGYIQAFFWDQVAGTQEYRWVVRKSGGGTGSNIVGRIYCEENVPGFGSALFFHAGNLYVSDQQQHIYIYAATTAKLITYLATNGVTPAVTIPFDPSIFTSCNSSGIRLRNATPVTPNPIYPMSTGFVVLDAPRFLIGIYDFQTSDLAWKEVGITVGGDTVPCIADTQPLRTPAAFTAPPTGTPRRPRVYPSQSLFTTLQRSKDHRNWFLHLNDPYIVTSVGQVTRYGAVQVWVRLTVGGI
jgi:hypothetical protein